MTGHGEAHCHRDGLAVSVEVRTLNSRYFKLTVRSSDASLPIESRVEAVVRKHVRRGAVQVHIRLDRKPGADDYQINATVLDSYRQQLQQVSDDTAPVPLSALLTLPGVVDDAGATTADDDLVWSATETALTEALQSLHNMRVEEGRAMATDLATNTDAIAQHLDRIATRAPEVVDAYRQRITERLGKLLDEYDVQADPAVIVREVGIFAERCDISEEIVRIRSHLEQFASIVGLAESNGRKLEFLIQELGRETNTIGSKANDAEISKDVIEIKTGIERLREMIQNVE